MRAGVCATIIVALLAAVAGAAGAARRRARGALRAGRGGAEVAAAADAPRASAPAPVALALSPAPEYIGYFTKKPVSKAALINKDQTRHIVLSVSLALPRGAGPVNARECGDRRAAAASLSLRCAHSAVVVRASRRVCGGMRARVAPTPHLPPLPFSSRLSVVRGRPAKN
jgi:hypothetical protein